MRPSRGVLHAASETSSFDLRRASGRRGHGRWRRAADLRARPGQHPCALGAEALRHLDLARALRRHQRQRHARPRGAQRLGLHQHRDGFHQHRHPHLRRCLARPAVAGQRRTPERLLRRLTFRLRGRPARRADGRIHPARRQPAADAAGAALQLPHRPQRTRGRSAVNNAPAREVCGGDFEAEFKRSDFGITHSLPFVGDAVRLVVQIEGVRR